MEHGKGVRPKPQSSSIPLPRFNQVFGTSNTLSHTGGTYSQSDLMDSLRDPIPELHHGKLRDSLEFERWKAFFKSVVCANSVLPQVTMHWIKEVEIEEQKTIL